RDPRPGFAPVRGGGGLSQQVVVVLSRPAAAARRLPAPPLRQKLLRQLRHHGDPLSDPAQIVLRFQQALPGLALSPVALRSLPAPRRACRSACHRNRQPCGTAEDSGGSPLLSHVPSWLSRRVQHTTSVYTSHASVNMSPMDSGIGMANAATKLANAATELVSAATKLANAATEFVNAATKLANAATEFANAATKLVNAATALASLVTVFVVWWLSSAFWAMTRETIAADEIGGYPIPGSQEAARESARRQRQGCPAYALERKYPNAEREWGLAVRLSGACVQQRGAGCTEPHGCSLTGPAAYTSKRIVLASIRNWCRVL